MFGIDGDIVLPWLLPAAAGAVLLVVLVWASVALIRRIRRGARARARAAAAIDAAGDDAVALDRAVEELDGEFALSGVLRADDAPAELRRARMRAQHRRNDAFPHLLTLRESSGHPARVRAEARRLSRELRMVLETVAEARNAHRAWEEGRTSHDDQIDVAASRLSAARSRMGTPQSLLIDLGDMADASEWTDAATAVARAEQSLDAAEEALVHARTLPPAQVRPALGAIEEALRTAERHARVVEEHHQSISQTARALSSEIDAAEASLRSAEAMSAMRPSPAAQSLRDEIARMRRRLAELRADGERRPTAANAEITALRHRIDEAVDDLRTPQQRLIDARTSLPGTLAAARHAITHVEAALILAPDLDLRIALEGARGALARARQATDPLLALAEARHALDLADGARSRLPAHDDAAAETA